MGRHRRDIPDPTANQIFGHTVGRHRLSAHSANQFRPVDAAWAKNNSRGFAGYIGRVGALAVALGIGAAVAVTPGTARADTVEDAPSTPSDPGPVTGGATATDPTAPAPPAPASPPAVKSPSSNDAPESAPGATSPSQSTVDLGGGVVLSSSGGAHTSSDSTAKPRVDLGDGVVLSSSGGAHTGSDSTAKPRVDLGDGVVLSGSGGAHAGSGSTAGPAPAGIPPTTRETAALAAAVAPRHPDNKSGHSGLPPESVQRHTPHNTPVAGTPVVSAATVSIDVDSRDRIAAPTQPPAVTVVARTRRREVGPAACPSSGPPRRRRAIRVGIGCAEGAFGTAWVRWWRRVPMAPSRCRSCGRCWPRHGARSVPIPSRCRCPTETCCAPTSRPLTLSASRRRRICQCSRLELRVNPLQRRPIHRPLQPTRLRNRHNPSDRRSARTPYHS